jgi:hypothetical protein
VCGLAQRILVRVHWNLARQSFHIEGFVLVELWRAFPIGPMSADQHKQIGIRRGATPFYMATGFIKQNKNFEKSQELKGRSENF